MMDGLRKAGQSWFGRILMTILFGFLIFSFALWGIGDIFRGYGMKSVATVGKTDVDAQVYRQSFQAELQSLSRRYGQTISVEQAIGFGLDQEVLRRLIADAALDDKAKAMKLGISDDAIAKTLLTDPNFIGADGKFDKARFNEALRASGYTEASFIAAQRAVDLRQQIIQGLSSPAVPPTMMTDAMARFTNEERSISYITIGKDQLGAETLPDDAALKAYFEENKANFRAPEYRKFSYVALDPASLSDPSKITDEEAKARYESDRDTIFTTPEKRTLRQIVFKTEADAKAAAERLAAGTTFDALVTERSLKPEDTDLGTIEKRGLADKAVAEAAFALEKDKTSDVIKGQFGFVIVTVTDVIAGSTKAFDEVADSIRVKLAQDKAKTAIRDLHDKIEDQRAAAKPLTEIAKENNLALVSVDAADRLGLQPDGTAIPALEGQGNFMKAVFASDVGVDNEPIATRAGGYIWFDVASITQPRDREFDEAKDKALNAWREDDLAKRLQAKATDLVSQLKAGKSIKDLGAELQRDVKQATGLKRKGAIEGLASATIAAAFTVPVKDAASAIGSNNDERDILVVESAALQDSATALAEAGRLADEARRALSDDYANAFILRTQQDLGVSVNDHVRAVALGLN